LINFFKKGILAIEGFQKTGISIFITTILFCTWNIISVIYEGKTISEIIEVLFALSMVTTVIIWFDNELKKTSSYLIKTQEIRSSQIMMLMVTDKVNNPLQTIALLVRELQSRYPNEYLLVEILSEIDRQTMRVGNGLKSIVNYTLDPVDSEWIEFFELNIALKDVMEIFKPLFVERGITVINSLSNEQILIKGKDSIFKQAILNIFNACYAVTEQEKGHGKVKVFSDRISNSANIRVYLESNPMNINLVSKNIYDPFCLSS
jgi:signal transduction histidine kinase